MFTRICVGAAIALNVLSTTAFADSWTLNSEASRIAFGSIKKNSIGEIHSFGGMTGTVSETGVVAVQIDLSTIETNIDIRNERMVEHVFKGAQAATLTADIDVEEVSALAVGGSSVIDVEGNLSFIGTDIEIEAEMFVIRVSETTVMVTTNDMIFLGTEDAGITAGVNKLMELAKLPSITRTSPVTLRFFFEADQKKAETAPAAPATPTTEVAALAGDPKAGKKVFKKCKACHAVKQGQHGVGPSLHGIIGRPAASIEGVNYSKAMAASGLTWDVDTLAAFLKKPRAVVKGTKMSFAGLKKDEQIDDVIAYLAEQQ